MLPCHHCGHPNADVHNYCGACGARISGPERSGATITAPESEGAPWVADPINGLRIRNTFREFEIKAWQREITIGRSDSCDITIDSAAVSSVHAAIERRPNGVCVVHDRTSKNGLLLGDGGRRRIFELTPGTLFMAGNVPLVAFSGAMQQLRRTLQRFLGFGDERHQRGVEDALEATGQRRHVLLASPPGGQALRLARIIHEAGPRSRQPFRAHERIPETRREQERMFKAAENGTLAFGVDELPDDMDHVRMYLRVPPYNVRIIAFGADPARAVGIELLEGESRRSVSIRIPALVERPESDRLRLISILSEEIGQRIGAPDLDAAAHTGPLLRHDWPNNLDELEQVVERLLVLQKAGGNQRRAAKALGLSWGKWVRWYGRFRRDA